MKQQQPLSASATTQSASANPHPALGIDLDGCVDECPTFFSLLTNLWPGKVYVLTFRHNGEQAIRDLAQHNIKYDELILVNSFNAKAEVIAQQEILVYFDDQPEMLKNIPPTVHVMLVRNGGNFCFDERLWMLSAQTGRSV